MSNKSGLIIGLVAIALIGFWAMNFYNGSIGLNEDVTKQWSNVENAYQLRADKTKNLVEIVKGAADFEKETLTEVIEARAKATSVNINANDLTPEKIQQFQAAQDQFSGALSRLMVTVERYPELKAVKGFQDFQVQYEGMENRIGVERKKYNDVARDFNTRVKRFPGNLIAGMFGFTEKGYFEAQEGTENAPDISFK
ncbi:MAG: LemA family protein [Flavobacteriales bacterium]|mgnify:CR=1 FL=1|jgi:LemA protein|nr:LemA family protein [Flavobacteriales bacterium]MBK6549542.1 LemA family protein [Flavobacteriales bacterium]MBK6883870.1 LemA family protein [Flavobacteriales bacterium]MBK7100262.1 LemA family protein [Flavobacteriales bacterium]MBK7110955.1 LemA family protein [Flavobacteriales bacterium]